MEEDLKKLGRAARRIVLDKNEREGLRLRIAAFQKDHPLPAGYTIDMPRRSLLRGWMPVLFSLPIARPMVPFLAAVLILLTAGGGAAYAAEGALPGDALYPIKTQVTERVLAGLAVTARGHAAIEASLAKRRLAEAETLAAGQGLASLDAKQRVALAENFRTHAENAKQGIAAVEQEGDADTAAELASDFEAGLRAHEQILLRLPAPAGKPEESDILIGNFLTHIAAARRDAAAVRLRAETIPARAATPGDKKTAEARLAAVEQKITATTRLIHNNGEAPGTGQTVAAADARIKAAALLYTEAKARIAAGAYPEAAASIRQANRAAEEAALLAAARRELNLDLRLGIKPKAKSSRHAEKKATDAAEPATASVPAPNALISGVVPSAAASASTTAADSAAAERERIGTDLTDTEDAIAAADDLLTRGRNRFGIQLTTDADAHLKQARRHLQEAKSRYAAGADTEADVHIKKAAKSREEAEIKLEANGILDFDL